MLHVRRLIESKPSTTHAVESSNSMRDLAPRALRHELEMKYWVICTYSIVYQASPMGRISHYASPQLVQLCVKE